MPKLGAVSRAAMEPPASPNRAVDSNSHSSPDLNPLRDDLRFKRMLFNAKERLGIAGDDERMTDIFISYARPDEVQAKLAGEALRGLGYGVWRDDELPAHRAYSEVIEERIKSAKAVLVLWTSDAARSQWVRAEADAAREAGTLVQVTLDGSLPPMPFNQIQCADLKGWTGDVRMPGWQKVVNSIASLAGTAGTPSIALETALPTRRRHRPLRTQVATRYSAARRSLTISTTRLAMQS